MSFLSLLKLSALFNLLTGLLLIIGWTLNIHRDSIIGATMVLIAYVLAIPSFMGLYLSLYSKLKLLGLIGFILIIMACALFTPWLFLDIARISEIIPGIEWQFVQENGPTKIIGIIGSVCFLLGFFAFGIDSYRAKIFNRLPSLILILAAISPLIYSLIPISKGLPRIGGFALICFSIELWKLTYKLQ